VDYVVRLAGGTAAALTVVLCTSNENLGVAFLLKDEDDPYANVLMLDAKTLPDGPQRGEFSGRTATHELGHTFGLEHVFEGKTCARDGDGVTDTPFQRTETRGCPRAKDSCPGSPGTDSVRNFMDYSADSCMTGFTSGQMRAMRAFVVDHKPSLMPVDLAVDDATLMLDGRSACRDRGFLTLPLGPRLRALDRAGADGDRLGHLQLRPVRLHGRRVSERPGRRPGQRHGRGHPALPRLAPRVAHGRQGPHRLAHPPGQVPGRAQGVRREGARRVQTLRRHRHHHVDRDPHSARRVRLSSLRRGGDKKGGGCNRSAKGIRYIFMPLSALFLCHCSRSFSYHNP
jgi:hypothetical protein